MANSRNSRSLFTPNSRNSRSLKRDFKIILQIKSNFRLVFRKNTGAIHYSTIFSAGLLLE